MEPEERKLKGAVLRGYYKFIRKKWGVEGQKECEAATGVIDGNLKEEIFYPNEWSVKIQEWMSSTHGMPLCRQCGAFTVQNLGILAYLVKFANIKFLLKRAPKSYGEAFNFGRMEVALDEDNKRAVLRMYDANYNQEACEMWWGVFEGCLEMTRTKGTVQKVLCQREDSGHCEYVIEWE